MSSVKPLTPKQKRLLDSIKTYLSEYGYPPTLKDISGMIKENGESTALSTAQYYIEVLTKKGYLDKETGQERGISFKKNSIQIPKLGFIAAGSPIEPIEDPEYIEVPSTIKMTPSYQYYALEVTGDSMIYM